MHMCMKPIRKYLVLETAHVAETKTTASVSHMQCLVS